MKDTQKPPETFLGMEKRHKEELKIFQEHCNHEQVSCRYPPFIICTNCQKFLHEATDEELDAEGEINLFKRNEVYSENGKFYIRRVK